MHQFDEPVTDALFDSAPPDGTLAADTSTGDLYLRVGGEWKSVTLS